MSTSKTPAAHAAAGDYNVMLSSLPGTKIDYKPRGVLDSFACRWTLQETVPRALKGVITADEWKARVAGKFNQVAREMTVMSMILHSPPLLLALVLVVASPYAFTVVGEPFLLAGGIWGCFVMMIIHASCISPVRRGRMLEKLTQVLDAMNDDFASRGISFNPDLMPLSKHGLPFFQVVVAEMPAKESSRAPAAPRRRSSSGSRRVSRGSAAAASLDEGAKQCVQCQNSLSPSAKFCMECGSKQSASCTGCQAALPPSAKFCVECGINV